MTVKQMINILTKKQPDDELKVNIGTHCVDITHVEQDELVQDSQVVTLILDNTTKNNNGALLDNKSGTVALTRLFTITPKQASSVLDKFEQSIDRSIEFLLQEHDQFRKERVVWHERLFCVRDWVSGRVGALILRSNSEVFLNSNECGEVARETWSLYSAGGLDKLHTVLETVSQRFGCKISIGKVTEA